MIEFTLLLILSIGLSATFHKASLETFQNSTPKMAIQIENHLETGSGFVEVIDNVDWGNQ